MASKELLTCDYPGCKREASITSDVIQRLWFTVDRRADVAGGMEDVCEYVDVCAVHLKRAIEASCKSHEDGIAWLARLGKNVPNGK